MVFEQVDLVDVQKSAVRLRQQAWLKSFFAVDQCAFDIQCADNAILCGAQRQVDDRYGHSCGVGRVFGFAAPITKPGSGRMRVAVVGAVAHHINLWEQGGKRTNGGGFSRAPFAEHQHTANAGVHRSDSQRPAHIVLSDYGGKRISDAH